MIPVDILDQVVNMDKYRFTTIIIMSEYSDQNTILVLYPYIFWLHYTLYLKFIVPTMPPMDRIVENPQYKQFLQQLFKASVHCVIVIAT